MATLLDVGILGHFSSIFIVILLFALIYGVLEATKPFGDKKQGIHAIIALFIGFLFMVSRLASAMVQVLVPWFIIVIVFLFFVLLLFRMFGVDDKMFKDAVKMGSVYPWIIVFSLLVLFGALSTVFGQSLLEAGGGTQNAQAVSQDTGYTSADAGTIPVEYVAQSGTATSSFSTNFVNTIRNPKILGMIFIFLTGAFLMIFLTRPVNP